MGCPFICKPVKPGDWTPCIECMDELELTQYRRLTGDNRETGRVPESFHRLREQVAW